MPSGRNFGKDNQAPARQSSSPRLRSHDLDIRPPDVRRANINRKSSGRTRTDSGIHTIEVGDTIEVAK
eukprot:4421017-Pleurochrysis_carterae.AAC.1